MSATRFFSAIPEWFTAEHGGRILGYAVRRCAFLFHIRRVGWSCRRHAPPFGAIGSVGSRNCHTMRITARDPTLAGIPPYPRARARAMAARWQQGALRIYGTRGDHDSCPKAPRQLNRYTHVRVRPPSRR